MTEYIDVEDKRFLVGLVEDLPKRKRRRREPGKTYPEVHAFANLPEGKALLIEDSRFTLNDIQVWWRPRFRSRIDLKTRRVRSRQDYERNGVWFWCEPTQANMK